jgi:hypothetical protein
MLAGFFLVLDRGLFFLISLAENGFYKEKTYRERFTNYVQERDFNMLIMGTSRTYEALHPVYFKESKTWNPFKEAQFGKNPKYNYYFYKEYKKVAGIPEVVVYGIDYFIFNTTSNKRWLARFDLIDDGRDYLGAPSMLVANKLEIDDFINDIINRYREKWEGVQVDRNRMDFVEIQGYSGIQLEKSEVVTKKPRLLKKQKYLPYPGVEGPYLKMLLEELDKDGVTVVLLILPDHFGTYRTNFNRRRLRIDLKRLSQGMPKVHIANYNLPKKFPLKNVSFFMNGGWGKTNSHLSKEGAKRFSRMFIKDLTNLLRPEK